MTTTARVTARLYSGSQADARGRKLVVALLPGDTVMIRPAGTRRAEYMTVSALYDILLMSRVRSERMQKLNHKRRGKK